MQKVLLYTGYNRWLSQSEAFVRGFDVSFLITNNPAYFTEKTHLFTQTVQLDVNTHRKTPNVLTFPVLELYTIGFSLLALYRAYDFISKDSYVYVGHTDTCMDLAVLDEIVCKNKNFSSFVWRRKENLDTFHSDAYILNLRNFTNDELIKSFSTFSAVRNAEHEVTSKLKILGPCFIIGDRDYRSNGEGGFYHVH